LPLLFLPVGLQRVVKVKILKSQTVCLALKFYGVNFIYKVSSYHFEKLLVYIMDAVLPGEDHADEKEKLDKLPP
jgi:hypothetical protein